MKLPEDAFLQGPLPPSAPYDPFERSVLNSAEHGEDSLREEYVHALLVGMPRPLTVPEKWAASEDHARAPRVYAPASARVPKQPLPWDAELMAAGRLHTITSESAKHPGDSSDPSELR